MSGRGSAMKFSDANPPKINTWVTVLPESLSGHKTRSGRMRAADRITSSTPALISAVTLDIITGGVATVLYPCPLVLRHGFTGAPLKRLTDVPFSRLRGYSSTGGSSMEDMQQLMLAAVRASAAQKRVEVKEGLSRSADVPGRSCMLPVVPPESETDTSSVREPVPNPGASWKQVGERAPEDDEASHSQILGADESPARSKDTTQENINTLFIAGAQRFEHSSEVSQTPRRESQRHTTQENISVLFAAERVEAPLEKPLVEVSRDAISLRSGENQVLKVAEIDHRHAMSSGAGVEEPSSTEMTSSGSVVASSTPRRTKLEGKVGASRILKPFVSSEKEPEVRLRSQQRSRSPRNSKIVKVFDGIAFTQAVSQAFGKHMHLPVETLIASLQGAGMDSHDIARGLDKLEDQNKIFSADDIMFRID